MKRLIAGKVAGTAGVTRRTHDRPGDRAQSLPELLSAEDVAAWLRTTKKAVYLMVARGQLPKPLKIGRRLLWDRQSLANWIAEKRVASLRSQER